MDIYVDVDGTLLDPSLDRQYAMAKNILGLAKALQQYESTYVDNLQLNMPLIARLQTLKDKGHRLVLWTNRGPANIAMTKANLGQYWALFDEHQFHDGQKIRSRVNGLVLDNEPKYRACARHFIQVTF